MMIMMLMIMVSNRRGKVSSPKEPNASSDLKIHLCRRHRHVDHQDLCHHYDDDVDENYPKTGFHCTIAILSSKSVKGTKTVHLRETSQIFLFPWFYISQLKKQYYILNFSVLSKYATLKISLKENCLFFLFQNFSKTNIPSYQQHIHERAKQNAYT